LQCFNKFYNHKVWMSVGIIYTLLLLEQSFLVAFVSSGISLIFILCLLFRYKKNTHD